MNTLKKLSVVLLLLIATCVANALVITDAHAFPAYAKKEKKPCLYCHVNAGGGGKRNAAGTWYKNHALSFAGYTPAKANAEAAKKSTTSPKPKPKPKATPKPKGA